MRHLFAGMIALGSRQSFCSLLNGPSFISNSSPLARRPLSNALGLFLTLLQAANSFGVHRRRAECTANI
jgi:hypothetical protein